MNVHKHIWFIYSVRIKQRESAELCLIMTLVIYVMEVKKILTKKIYLATDHAGFEAKEIVKKYLSESGADFEDLGAHTYDKNDDYPDYISLAAERVSRRPESTLAIIFGGSGQGEAMVANRYPNVRATVYYDGPREILDLSKEHNKANILSIGARFVSEEYLIDVVKYWLEKDFLDEERHLRRVEKIEKLDIKK